MAGSCQWNVNFCLDSVKIFHNFQGRVRLLKVHVDANWTSWSRDYDKKIHIKSLEGAKAKICGKSKRWKKRKITSFLIPKERTEIGTLPRPVQSRSAVRSCSVKLVGLFEITSFWVGFQTCDYFYRFRNTIFQIFSSLHFISCRLRVLKHTTKKWRPCWKSGLVSSHLVLFFTPDERI